MALLLWYDKNQYVFGRNPQNLAECVNRIQDVSGIQLPKEEADWYEIPRMEVDIRRSNVLNDALREGPKKNFDPNKVLKVFICCNASYMAHCLGIIE